MGRKRKKTRRDVAEVARSVVEQAIGEPLAEAVGDAAPSNIQDTEPDDEGTTEADGSAQSSTRAGSTTKGKRSC